MNSAAGLTSVEPVCDAIEDDPRDACAGELQDGSCAGGRAVVQVVVPD